MRSLRPGRGGRRLHRGRGGAGGPRLVRDHGVHVVCGRRGSTGRSRGDARWFAKKAHWPGAANFSSGGAHDALCELCAPWAEGAEVSSCTQPKARRAFGTSLETIRRMQVSRDAADSGRGQRSHRERARERSRGQARRAEFTCTPCDFLARRHQRCSSVFRGDLDDPT